MVVVLWKGRMSMNNDEINELVKTILTMLAVLCGGMLLWFILYLMLGVIF